MSWRCPDCQDLGYDELGNRFWCGRSAREHRDYFKGLRIARRKRSKDRKKLEAQMWQIKSLEHDKSAQTNLALEILTEWLR